MENQIKYFEKVTFSFLERENVIDLLGFVDTQIEKPSQRKVFENTLSSLITNAIVPLDNLLSFSFSAATGDFSVLGAYHLALNKIVSKYGQGFPEIVYEKLFVEEEDKFIGLEQLSSYNTTNLQQDSIFNFFNYHLITKTLPLLFDKSLNKAPKYSIHTYNTAINYLLLNTFPLDDLYVSFKNQDINATVGLIDKFKATIPMLQKSLPKLPSIKLPLIIIKPKFPLPVDNDTNYPIYPHGNWVSGEAIEAWRRIGRCINLSNLTSQLTINEVYNTTKNIRGRACPNDIIELRGENLGQDGEIFLNNTLIPFISWNQGGNGEIIAQVPSNAQPGDRLGIYGSLNSDCDNLFLENIINPRKRISTRVGRRLNPNNNLSLEIIGQLSLDIRLLDENLALLNRNTIYRIEACKQTYIRLNYANVERVEIKNLTNNSILYSTVGNSSTTTIDIPTLDLRNNSVYQITVQNLCTILTENIEINYQYRIHINEETKTSINQRVVIPFSISCIATSNLTFNVRFQNDVDNALTIVTSSININRGSNSGNIVLTINGICNHITSLIIEDARDLYIPQSFRIAIEPFFIRIEPNRQFINEPLTIIGRGFAENGIYSVIFPSMPRPIQVTATRVLNTSLSVNIPEDAITGDITVIANNNCSSVFRLIILPSLITAITPNTNIRLGDNISIYGRGFSLTNTNNSIIINGLTEMRLPAITSSRQVGGQYNGLTKIVFTLQNDIRYYASVSRLQVRVMAGNMVNFADSAPVTFTQTLPCVGSEFTEVNFFRGGPRYRLEVPGIDIVRNPSNPDIYRYTFRGISGEFRVFIGNLTPNRPQPTPYSLGGLQFSSNNRYLTVLSVNHDSFNGQIDLTDLRLSIYAVENNGNARLVYPPDQRFSFINDLDTNTANLTLVHPRIYFSNTNVCPLAIFFSSNRSGGGTPILVTVINLLSGREVSDFLPFPGSSSQRILTRIVVNENVVIVYFNQIPSRPIQIPN